MNFSIDELSAQEPYSLRREQKRAFFRRALSDLTRFHAERCGEYRRILETIGVDPSQDRDEEEQPMLPARLFKEYPLHSVSKDEVVKTMTSSGTTGQQVSKIFLDKKNARDQTRVLTQIVGSYIGGKRLPLLILDTEQVKTNRTLYSARGAGIIGFSIFGRDALYALDEEMRFRTEAIRAFLDEHADERILMFGYTYMIWHFIVQTLEAAGEALPIENGVLFHSGGWKKLANQAVDSGEFNRRLNAVLGGNTAIYNYYGMVEQLGSIFVECEYGHMHCSNYSDIIIRRPRDFSVASLGEKGLVELLSLLPTSYPGHILLTEDEGEILGEDDCPCGRMGKYFKIDGRLKGAELRGCSDTYERR